MHADLSHLGTGCNDMVVLPDGRIYADVYPDSPVGPLPGAVALVTPDGQTRIVAAGHKTPNGIAVTPDRSTLYLSCTRDHAVFAYTIGADGTLSDRRTFFRGEPTFSPDGVCLDRAGGLWVADYRGGEFLRVLEGGQITHKVVVQGWWAVAVALGGDDGRTLYLAANRQVGDEALGNLRREGRIEAVRVEVPGAGWP